uniref:Putative antimicrobial peptide A Northern Europe Heligoland variant n=1 Tax=Ciona intestinalis TaxID=7719 RepID=A6YPB1_CIOIN|nr:putative antimicrobial peptide A Northern Europe Heligoland variant [Ciona intestinalis]
MKFGAAFVLEICLAVSADAALRGALRAVARVGKAILPHVAIANPYVRTPYVHNNPDWSLWRSRRRSGNQQPTSQAEILEDALEAQAIEALMQQ